MRDVWFCGFSGDGMFVIVEYILGQDHVHGEGCIPLGCMYIEGGVFSY